MDELKPDELLNLRLTCKHFWNVCQHELNLWIRCYLGMLAGKNIVCVGDHLAAEEFPVGILSPDERARFENHCTDSITNDGKVATYFSYAEKTYKGLPPLGLLYEYLECHRAGEEDFNIFRKLSLVGLRLWSSNSEETIKFFCSRFRSFYREDEEYVLRNLTTKELIRAKSVAADPDDYLGINFRKIRFGHALLSRIVLSGDRDGNLATLGNSFPRGPWAGHKFDITLWKRHLEETQGEDWKDVGKEVDDEVNLCHLMMDTLPIASPRANLMPLY